ncbi:lipase [Nitrosomonas sp. PY1]|uniref:lipase family protein n=1 Tax=Nitrosomonas sp. PY1 TaxID=1803906 RepID=UPI001FC80B62|nr:lipase [Nitrosomonas sp. PY1]
MKFLTIAKFISFISLISVASTTHALSEECSKSTASAYYLDTIGLVCLQKIITIDPSDSNIYKSTLQWLGSSDPALSHQFLLTGLEFDNLPAELNSPVFSFANGILSIPKIDIPKQFGTERYSVDLKLVSIASETIFQLDQVAIYINPDYVAGRDWKPFGMLPSEERRAVDLLGRSLPYMQLADLVYDFDNTTVGTWKLIETKNKTSGMDAGVYENQNTNPKEIALVFRGTEPCCSLDYVRDITADAAIATGTVSDQFKDAFNFARDVINRYPGAKIIVAGHSLGGGLAQAVGATLGLETFAFNSSPVPDHFFDTYTITLPEEKIAELIHVIADIHDPVSNADESGDLYINAHHVTPLLQFNFETKEILPIEPVRLRKLRFDRHSITELYLHSSTLMNIYMAGW